MRRPALKKAPDKSFFFTYAKRRRVFVFQVPVVVDVKWRFVLPARLEKIATGRNAFLRAGLRNLSRRFDKIPLLPRPSEPPAGNSCRYFHRACPRHFVSSGSHEDLCATRSYRF